MKHTPMKHKLMYLLRYGHPVLPVDIGKTLIKDQIRFHISHVCVIIKDSSLVILRVCFWKFIWENLKSGTIVLVLIVLIFSIFCYLSVVVDSYKVADILTYPNPIHDSHWFVWAESKHGKSKPLVLVDHPYLTLLSYQIRCIPLLFVHFLLVLWNVSRFGRLSFSPYLYIWLLGRSDYAHPIPQLSTSDRRYCKLQLLK